MISLTDDTITNNDIDDLIGWLKTYPRLTKGPLTEQLESEFASWLGSKYSVFVNSGSSANLLMLYSLIEMKHIKLKDKVIVPTLSWATDLSPVIQLGLEPVLCDCNLDDLSIDISHLKKIIVKDKPKVLMLVSVLGLVPNMDEIIKICDENDIIILEDVCESLGSEYNNQKLGTFGLMSSFSTYFSHHISTIEGGFICTDDEELYNILKSLRSHGWDRDMDDKHKKQLRRKYDIDDFSSAFTFYHPGFNLRATDLQAFLGLGQLKKLDNLIKIRNENYQYYDKHIKNDYWKPLNYNNRFISSFAYPILNRKRVKLIKILKANGIECRPLICGSHGNQPVYKEKYGRLKLPNAQDVDRYGLYLPNNPSITKEEIKLICNIVNSVGD